MDNYKQLKARFDEAKNYKDRWLSIYKDLYMYVIPNRDAFNVKFKYRDDGKPNTNEIWDNTAVLAAYQRANDLHGLLLPQDRIWGKLILDPHLYTEKLIDSAQELMDEINDRIFFYINDSNLGRVVSSSNLDLVGGTAAIWLESIDDENPLYFRSIPAVCLFMEYSTDDVIENCWYTCDMTGRQVLATFPKYKGQIKDLMVERPNENYTVNYGQVQLAEDSYFIYAVLENDPFVPLFEVERSYKQIIIYRDRVRPGEAEGRGVGTDLLPSIKDLNKIVMYSRKSLALKANPPLFYEAGTYFNPHSVRQWSGALIAKAPGGRNPIEALQMPESPETYNHILHLQDIIQKGFQVDPLGEIQAPVRSATEVSIRENRAQRTSATDISRLINELPKQVYEISAKILNERGLLVKKRQAIPGFNTKKLKFKYQSPLFDLQNQAEINAFVSNLQIKQQFFGAGAAIATCNLPEVNKFLTQKFNLDRKLFASDDDLKQFLVGLSQQQSQQQEQQAPSPSTSASSVDLPQNPGVTI